MRTFRYTCAAALALVAAGCLDRDRPNDGVAPEDISISIVEPTHGATLDAAEFVAPGVLIRIRVADVDADVRATARRLDEAIPFYVERLPTGLTGTEFPLRIQTSAPTVQGATGVMIRGELLDPLDDRILAWDSVRVELQ